MSKIGKAKDVRIQLTMSQAIYLLRALRCNYMPLKRITTAIGDKLEGNLKLAGVLMRRHPPTAAEGKK